MAQAGKLCARNEQDVKGLRYQATWFVISNVSPLIRESDNDMIKQ